MSRVALDPRVEQTRAALQGAFVELFYEHGYDEISAADIARCAGVGRSTFYEHYRGKEGLLLSTIRRPLEPLATLVDQVVDEDAILGALDHYWTNRNNSRAVRRDSSRRAMVRVLADVLAQRLRSRGEPEPSAKRLGSLVAELSFGAITGWLAGTVDMTPVALASALRRCARAALAAD